MNVHLHVHFRYNKYIVLYGKTVKKKPAMPWYNDEIKGLKRDRRKAERQWLQHRGDPIKM